MNDNPCKFKVFRKWVTGLLLASVLAVAGQGCDSLGPQTVMKKMPLPYPENALEPYISAQTVRLHYSQHYAAYVEAANRLIFRSPFRGKSPEDVMNGTFGKKEHADIFNQTAQAWNHAFFWQSIRPGGGSVPAGRLAEKIDEAFGSFDSFKKQFIATAASQFGSGWVWLVLEKDRLKIISTSNADTPVVRGTKPLLVVDVWEHAYYLDYQNRKADFVGTVLEHLANWEFASGRLTGQKAVIPPGRTQ